MQSLASLERWFQGEIVRPYEKRTSRGKNVSTKNSSRILLPSKTLRAEQRLNVYTKMYFWRLRDCLLEDYPTIYRLLGDARFDRLAKEYLERFPSRHYSLNALGRKLPKFLANSKNVPRRALLTEISKLECAMSEIFDEEETTILAGKELQKFSPAQWEKLRLKIIPAFRLLALSYPANSAVSAVHRESKIPKLGAKKTWVAVYRKNFAVWRRDLDRAEYETLQAIAQGKTISQSLRMGARAWDGSPAALQNAISHWFRDWMNEGFFSTVSMNSKEN